MRLKPMPRWLSIVLFMATMFVLFPLFISLDMHRYVAAVLSGALSALVVISLGGFKKG